MSHSYSFYSTWQWPLSWLQVSSHVSHLSSVVSPTQWAWQKSPSPITLKVLTTYAHTLTDIPLIIQVKLSIFICGLGKKTKKQSEILIVQQEQMKQFTHSRQQHLTLAASRGQACDSCGSEGNNREDIWKTQHFLSEMRSISQRIGWLYL